MNSALESPSAYAITSLSYSGTPQRCTLPSSTLDINCLSEQELYDPNTIGSMLKT
jgi:hypothetical protein